MAKTRFIISCFTWLYSHFVFCRQSLAKKARRSPGGLILYVHEDLIGRVSIVQLKHRDDRIWIKVAKSISRLVRDIYILSSSMFPQRGPLDSVQLRQNIDPECMEFSFFHKNLILFPRRRYSLIKSVSLITQGLIMTARSLKPTEVKLIKHGGQKF